MQSLREGRNIYLYDWFTHQDFQSKFLIQKHMLKKLIFRKCAFGYRSSYQNKQKIQNKQTKIVGNNFNRLEGFKFEKFQISSTKHFETRSIENTEKL